MEMEGWGGVEVRPPSLREGKEEWAQDLCEEVLEGGRADIGM